MPTFFVVKNGSKSAAGARESGGTVVGDLGDHVIASRRSRQDLGLPSSAPRPPVPRSPGGSEDLGQPPRAADDHRVRPELVTSLRPRSPRRRRATRSPASLLSTSAERPRCAPARADRTRCRESVPRRRQGHRSPAPDRCKARRCQFVPDLPRGDVAGSVRSTVASRPRRRIWSAESSAGQHERNRVVISCATLAASWPIDASRSEAPSAAASGSSPAPAGLRRQHRGAVHVGAPERVRDAGAIQFSTRQPLTVNSG